MTRGIVYTVWGNYDRMQLARSVTSAKKFGYQHEVVDATDWPGRKFQKRQSWLTQPFDTTLFLDTDTEIMANIDFGFEMAEKHGIACCLAPAGMSYYADDNQLRNIHPRDLPQYNCGVVFVGPQGHDVIMLYAKYLTDYPQSADNDQPYFTYACFQTLNPYILPRNYNWRKRVRYEGPLFGDPRIIHTR